MAILLIINLVQEILQSIFGQMEKMDEVSNTALRTGKSGYEQEFWVLNAHGEQRCMREDVTIIYISHVLEEVARIADRFTVLRDGRSVGGGAVAGTSASEIVHLMAGRELSELFPRSARGPGDVVLDLGAYKGESSVWLASQAGPSGRVLALEPNPAARAFLERNAVRAAGAGMAQIQILPVAVGSSPRRESFISTAESCSRLDTGGDMPVEVTTLDDVVSEHRLARVDFIKMDIEGGEVEALKGARQTILRHAPRLAISVYHLAHDLPDVVAVIREVRPDYRFFLSHKSPGMYETVLFASVEDRG